MRVSRLAFAAALGALSALVVAQAADEPLPVRAQPVKKGGVKAGKAVQNDVDLTDDQALARAKLNATDGGKLIEYLQQRTLTDTEQGRIEAVIKRFGEEDFEVRVRATEEVEAFGSAAIGPLKAAARDSDPEIAYRARFALKRVETVPHAAVAAAAVRAVVKLKPDGAAAALVGFLPLADDESVADAIREALITLAVGSDGKADPGLVAALGDGSPVRRSAAYVALTRGGPQGERIRIKDAYPKVRAAVLKETDTEAKFAGLWTLALTVRENEYIAELIALIPKLQRGRIWQLEDLLLQIAKTHPKDGRFLRSPESLANARDAWLGWWQTKAASFDFAKMEYKPRIEGFTDLVEIDARLGGPGRVVSLGLDLKERWRINGVNSPTDMRIEANRVFVVESNYNRIGEFSIAGKPVKYTSVNAQPLNLNLLPDGGQLVVCRNQVFENDKNGKQSWGYTRPNGMHDVMTGHRLPNGDTLLVTISNNGVQQKTMAYRIDGKGKLTGKEYTFGLVQNLQTMDAFEEEKVLICEWTTVAEYDLKTGKQTWKYDCAQPSSCQRLYNGNTLIAQTNHGNGGRIIEVDPSGEIVWDYESKDGLRVTRAYRR